MQPDDPAGHALAHHLVEGTLVATRQHILHRAEVGGIDLHRSQLLLGLRLGHADTGHGRVAEYGRRNAVIIDAGRLVAIDGVGKGLALANGDRGQLDTVGDIADRIDAGAGRLVVLIDFDRPDIVQLDARRLQAQAIGVGHAASGEHDQIDLDRVMARHGDLERSVVQLFDPLEGRVEAEIDPLHHRNLEQPVADRQVVAAQDFFAAIDQRDVRAELVEDAGKFIGDIARARDQHALGDRVEMERLVGGDAMLMAGATRDGGMRADRDQDALGGLLRAVGQPHAVGTGDDGALVDDLDAVAFQRLLIGAVQAIDFGQDIVAQGRPGEFAFARHLPAEAARVLQILGEMRTVDEQLLRHTAANDAGAADAIFLGHRHARAMRRRHARGTRAPGPCANDEQVIVILSHGVSFSGE